MVGQANNNCNHNVIIAIKYKQLANVKAKVSIQHTYILILYAHNCNCFVFKAAFLVPL